MSPSAAPATPQVHATGHVSGHGHDALDDHSHDHGHTHGHGQGHVHRHPHAQAKDRAPTAEPARGWRGPPSLLMAGAGARLFGVAGLLVLLWAAVAWALGEPA